LQRVGESVVRDDDDDHDYGDGAPLQEKEAFLSVQRSLRSPFMNERRQMRMQIGWNALCLTDVTCFAWLQLMVFCTRSLAIFGR